jgi:hypothetical protein
MCWEIAGEEETVVGRRAPHPYFVAVTSGPSERPGERVGAVHAPVSSGGRRSAAPTLLVGRVKFTPVDLASGRTRTDSDNAAR